jgi:hypothetical protein
MNEDLSPSKGGTSMNIHKRHLLKIYIATSEGVKGIK